MKTNNIEVPHEEPRGLILKEHCNACRQVTKHTVLKSQTTEHSNEEAGVWLQTRLEMLECCGCEEVMLRRCSHFSEDDEPSMTFYPPRVARWIPMWNRSLPRLISRLLEEIYTALHADSRCLTMMGARTVIENAMVLKVEDNGSFTSNLEAFEKAGYVSKQNRLYLEAALDAGSAAAHRGLFATTEQLETVMDIVENLLHSVFVLEKPSVALKAAVPPRPPRKKNATS